MTSAVNLINEAKRLVIKIGSSTLVDSQFQLRLDWLSALAADIAMLIKDGKEVIIVSSGSIAAGRPLLGLSDLHLTLSQKQAAASVGMGKLIHIYDQAFNTHQLPIGQILLTLEDSENRRRYLNARNTILTLTSLGAVPVINENDTIATAEIKVGDNDRLAARVAAMTSADLLIMLSDIDGLYTSNPKYDNKAKHIATIHEISEDIERIAEGTHSNLGTGGMKTKIMAAKICMVSGVHMVLMDGGMKAPIHRLMQGERSSLFIHSQETKSARKTWIATSLKPMGYIVINQGAQNALYDGKSLLAIGVIKVDGQFSKGDAIAIYSEEGQEIGRGLINYNSSEASKIKGIHSDQIETCLGYKNRDVLIHRNNLTLL